MLILDDRNQDYPQVKLNINASSPDSPTFMSLITIKSGGCSSLTIKKNIHCIFYTYWFGSESVTFKSYFVIYSISMDFLSNANVKCHLESS